MEKQIQEQLNKLEAQHDIRILFACESGSRAWGFASPDSDYDVRFAYVHRRDWYLGIDRGADFIEGTQDAVLDIRGVELRRLLQLFRTSNVSVYEWLQSPIWYRKEEAFVEKLWALADSYFSSKTGMHHYLGLTRNTVDNYLQGGEVKLKKYFYALRPVLAAAWIKEYNNCPPMEFGPLRAMISGAVVQERIEALVAQKRRVEESFRVAPDRVLNRFIGELMAQCTDSARILEKKEVSAAHLNELFRAIINQSWTYKVYATGD